MNLFETSGGNQEGLAEANLLYSMVYNKRAKMKAVKKAERHSSSMASGEASRYHEYSHKLKAIPDVNVDFTDEDMRYLKAAQFLYTKLNHEHGLARVSLEIASRYFESGFRSGDTSAVNDIRFNLDQAKYVFSTFKDYINEFE